MSPRLKTGIYVRALLRRAELAGASVYVARRGTEEAGALFLRLAHPGGTCTVLSQARRGDGELVWIKPLGESCYDASAEKYFEKQIRVDPDLWIVEIEDRDGRSFVDEAVV